MAPTGSEDAFAAQNIDNLGYCITTKGILPQTEKIAPILAFKPQLNQKQVISFNSFTNNHKKLWHHCSHDQESLTGLSKKGTKVIWGPKQQTAFDIIKRTIAHYILIHFPTS
eukprot:3076513-Ditylum_brightwellii.AAC.1